MLDLKFIRENPDLVKAALAKKGDTGPIDEIVDLDRQRRETLQESESLKYKRNTTSQQISKMKDQEERNRLIAEMRQVGDRIKELDVRVDEIDAQLQSLLLQVPNLPDESVPVGQSDADNIPVRYWGTPPVFDYQPKPHWEIGESLGIIDFERGVKVSGARFYVLKGLGAKLERAIINFMLDVHTTMHGYTEILPPFIVKRESMVGTGQLPKFEEDAYRIEPDDMFLIPTAEVPVTNLYRDEIIEPGVLPIYHVAYTPCFRREAGAAGRDTRGIVRVHQFDKVEMVKFVAPETSYDELEKLLENAEHILQLLGLTYRISLMCTGDLGFTAAKKYDPEVWMPGQEKYVEISSCSNFEAFQSRRANIRYRPSAGEKPEFVHTINGSGLAVGRTMAAILENYQTPEGSVRIPEILIPYMGGVEVIGA